MPDEKIQEPPRDKKSTVAAWGCGIFSFLFWLGVAFAVHSYLWRNFNGTQDKLIFFLMADAMIAGAILLVLAGVWSIISKSK